jgi:hypothetical protein
MSRPRKQPSDQRQRSERVERIATWLEGLCTATYGFQEKSKQKWLREAARLLRELDRGRIEKKEGTMDNQRPYCEAMRFKKMTIEQAIRLLQTTGRQSFEFATVTLQNRPFRQRKKEQESSK